MKDKCRMKTVMDQESKETIIPTLVLDILARAEEEKQILEKENKKLKEENMRIAKENRALADRVDFLANYLGKY